MTDYTWDSNAAELRAEHTENHSYNQGFLCPKRMCWSNSEGHHKNPFDALLLQCSKDNTLSHQMTKFFVNNTAASLLPGCRRGSAHSPPQPLTSRDENKSTKTWSAWGGKVADLSKEKGQEPFLNALLLGSICTRKQVKLINHYQAVRIKQ